MQVPTRSHVSTYNVQAVPYVPYQPSFQPPVQMSFQPAFTQPCMKIQPGMYAGPSHAASKKSMRAVSPTRPSRSSVSGLRVTKTGKAYIPQMRLQAVHQLPYSPSLVPVMPLLHAPAFPLAPTQVVIDAALPLSGLDIKPWVDASSEFVMNMDFDVSSATRTRRMDLKELVAVMKDMSMGKRTIQALADKLVLHRVLENMDVPQMPALLSIEGQVNRKDIENFVRNELCGPNSQEVVIKPTHLSNGTGVIVVSQPKPEEVDSTIQFLHSHIQQFMAQKAGQHESVALRSLKPGFIVQPKYQSSVCFKTPLELRVVVLWGKARLGLWWWGRGSAPGEIPQRNAWVVRRPTKRRGAVDSACEQGEECGELTDEDMWDVVHEHTGSNPGFDKALELFRAHISAISACAEALAVAVGAPFLRCDFFVGSLRWGVRLNEVAYGCGVDYRNRTEEGRIVDDAPAIARILQEGMAQCRNRRTSEHFLTRLGVKGLSYADMSVMPLPAWARTLLPARAESLGQESEDQCVVPEDLCRTIHPQPPWRARQCRSSRGPSRRSHSWDEGAAQASSHMARRSASSAVWPHPRSSSFRASRRSEEPLASSKVPNFK